jgi:hypothetical protein
VPSSSCSTPRLSSWVLSQAWLLWSRTWCSPLCFLNCFCCTWAACVLFFFPIWTPVLDVPPFFCFGLVWPVLGFLGTVTSWGCVCSFPTSSICVCSYLASSSSTPVGMSLVRTGILHSSSQSLMAISMSPSVMQ